MFGLNYIIFRPHNVYGERQNIGDRYRNVVGIFMNKILQNKPLTIFGDGEQTRAYTYIGDVAPIIAKSISEQKAYNEIFNIGAEERYSLNILTKEIIKSMKETDEHEIDHQPPRKEVMHAYSTHEKVMNVLGYKTNTSLSEGLKKMANWVKQVGIKESQEFKNIEIEENLPPSWKK
tara:strand:- start:45 stop:572 length:528 start_codon:yes stop_codon:yes gene_type:complete